MFILSLDLCLGSFVKKKKEKKHTPRFKGNNGCFFFLSPDEISQITDFSSICHNLKMNNATLQKDFAQVAGILDVSSSLSS